MDKAQKRTAKAHFVAQIQAGQPWRGAAALAGLHISRSTAYRLLRVYRVLGEAGLQDGRHGHPIKLRGQVRSFLQAYCQQAPDTPSSAIQTLLQERFRVSVSVSQINRVRAALGISNHPESRVLATWGIRSKKELKESPHRTCSLLSTRQTPAEMVLVRLSSS